MNNKVIKKFFATKVQRFPTNRRKGDFPKQSKPLCMSDLREKEGTTGGDYPLYDM